MAYWRMQLHPSDRARATMHTVQALARGLIGLGFDQEPGDLLRLSPQPPLPTGVGPQEFSFATKMARRDKVLVIVHNFPFALATVDSDYNYTSAPDGLGVWFRHFRRVCDVKYFADHELNANSWPRGLGFAGTIQILTDPTAPTYQLIENWQ